MNENDRGSWELFFRGLAMVGFLMNGDYTKEEIPALSYEMADAMMEEPKKEEGIASVKRVYRRKKDE